MKSRAFFLLSRDHFYDAEVTANRRRHCDGEIRVLISMPPAVLFLSSLFSPARFSPSISRQRGANRVHVFPGHVLFQNLLSLIICHHRNYILCTNKIRSLCSSLRFR